MDTTVHVSGQCHISAFANSVISLCKVVGHAVDNRDIISVNHDRSEVETSLSGKITILHEVGNLHKISSSIVNHESLSSFGHTRNSIIRISTISIPLINQVRIIIVVKMSSKLSLATLTNRSLSSGNVHSRFIVNIDLERLTDGNTTVRVRNHHSEGIRIVISGNPVLSIVVVINTTTNAFSFHTVLIPCIIELSIITTINPCDQVYIVNTSLIVRSEVTYIVVTSNRNNRVTFNKHHIGSDQSRFATINTEIDVSLILIRKCILIQNSHLFVESRSINARHQETILIPYITESCVNIDFTCFFVNNISGKINSFAFTNLKCIFNRSRSRMCLIDSQNLLQLEREYINSILTPSSTHCLVLSNIDHQDLAGVNVSGICTGSAVRNHSGITRFQVDFIPLINQVLHIIITEVSGSSNQTAFANGIIINRNNNSNGVANINIIRFTCSHTTVLIGDIHSEDVRMILCT